MRPGAFVIVGGMVVESIIDGTAHARHPRSPRSGSRLETFDDPSAVIGTRVPQAVVQPVVAMLPELELLRREPIAAPERRERHIAVTEARLRFRGRRTFELFARSDRLALLGCPCTDATRARPVVPVGLGLGCVTPVRRFRWRAPAAAPRASGRGSPRAGWRRARGPCGSRSWCRRRSHARRGHGATPPVPTAGRRAWRWPRSSRRAPATPRASASSYQRRNCSIGSGSTSSSRKWRGHPCQAKWHPEATRTPSRASACCRRAALAGRDRASPGRTTASATDAHERRERRRPDPRLRRR